MFTVNIPAVLNNLFQKLSFAISKGDLKEVEQIAQIADRKITEISPKITNEKTRKLLMQSIPLLKNFQEKLATNKASLSDARAFQQKAQEKLMQIAAHTSK